MPSESFHFYSLLSFVVFLDNRKYNFEFWGGLDLPIKVPYSSFRAQ